MDSARYGGDFIHPGIRFEGCMISKQDWELLNRGHEVEKEKSYRNLFIGIAASSGFGALSTFASHFKQVLSASMAPMEFAFLVLMISATLSTGALAVFFHRRVIESQPGRALRLLNETIQSQLEHPKDPNDPRQWP